MLTKDDILREIRRTAAENGGVAPGRTAFFAATGIRESDWSGRWWTTWGAAVREAGLEPQRLNPRLDDKLVLDAAARIVRKYGRFPTSAEIRLECNADRTLPSHNTFRRFGGLGGLRTRLRVFAAENGLSDVAAAIPEHPDEPVASDEVRDDDGTQTLSDGFVYLIKSGRHFKIGKANSVEARHRQLKIQLPQAAEVVHRIKTDDPFGIESYWHRRFADSRSTRTCPDTMTDLILYTTEDGRSQIKLRTDQQTVWLTQLEMADLFDATKQNISLHLKNVFEDGELGEGSVVKESLTTAADGKGYLTKLYNLDAILAVGYLSDSRCACIASADSRASNGAQMSPDIACESDAVKRRALRSPAQGDG